MLDDREGKLLSEIEHRLQRKNPELVRVHLPGLSWTELSDTLEHELAATIRGRGEDRPHE